MAHLGTVLKVLDLDGSEHYVTRSGLLYAYGDKISGLPLTLIQDAARIKDFGEALKRPKAIMDRVQASGYSFETRYDAAHGRRYMLGCYCGEPFSPDREQQRRIVIAAMDGIENLKEYHDA